MRPRVRVTLTVEQAQGLSIAAGQVVHFPDRLASAFPGKGNRKAVRRAYGILCAALRQTLTDHPTERARLFGPEEE